MASEGMCQGSEYIATHRSSWEERGHVEVDPPECLAMTDRTMQSMMFYGSSGCGRRREAESQCHPWAAATFKAVAL